VNSYLNNTWVKVSRIGLREDEGLHNFREVIFLNRLLAILPLVFVFYIPLEIYFNGVSMIYIVLMMLVLYTLPLLMHKYRWFNLARYWTFFTGSLTTMCAGLLVGKGINNYVTLIPILMVSTILFKTRVERILTLCFCVGFFFIQLCLFERIAPTVYVDPGAKTSLSYVFFILSMVLCFLVATYFIGINKEYEQIVNDQKEALSTKNSEITASITYAKRIQNAILPPESIIKSNLPRSFILYKPKDIVAGDFYWMDKVVRSSESAVRRNVSSSAVENNNQRPTNNTQLILFAAADSTGHGVPGAMVSVVCNNALCRSVREFSLSDPASILNKTREIIIDEFSKSHEDVNDGMDISLCALDPESLELQWAGANNPLVVISKGNIIEIKPDKQPVGRFSSAKPFTNHVIQLSKGDCIYIFSDGFADQFGGKEGKKLKYKVFKQLLFEYHGKPIEKQKELLEDFLAEWRNGHEQVDDVCVMGVQV
jgi:serine phosphatase RsbU (regulator of sigma subunit)